MISAAESNSDDDHLEHLLVYLQETKNYKRYVKPSNVTVSIGINYLCGILDERSDLLTSRVFERYKWNDRRLSWDPSKFGGLKLVHIPSHLVWLPDNLRALNSVHGFAERDDVSVAIDHEGHVYWWPLAVYKTLCTKSSSYRTDHTYHCYIGFGPWSQGKPSLPLQLLFQPGVELDNTIFYDQCPYIIEALRSEFKTLSYECCQEPFQLLSFHFELRRRGLMDGKRVEEKKKTEDCKWPNCSFN
jgi:hypothetical protein